MPPRISRAIAQTRRARSPVFSLASAACSIETRPRACNCDIRVHINCITDADPVLVDVKPREQEIAPYIRPVSQQCSFSNLLSIRDALNCTETGRLTGCPARVVSPSCPIFPPPHLTFIGFCAVLDRTRRHVSQFRHGDDQIPSGGSFRAVPQQHSIFDLRVARGVQIPEGAGPLRLLGMLMPT